MPTKDSTNVGPTNSMSYRLPAEWEPQEGVLLSWPYNRSDWPGKFQVIPWVYAEMIRHLLPGGKVFILVADEKHKDCAKSILHKAGLDSEDIHFIHSPMNRGWVRDSGPICLKDEQGRRQIARFNFNAWAKYRNFSLDNNTPLAVAEALDLEWVTPKHKNMTITLEGGAIDTNGAGTLLVTEECLLHPTVQVRNPGFSRSDYEELFSSIFNTPQTLWLEAGVAGDDTHGHIDDCCRFVNPNTVILCREDNPDDANHRVMAANRERFQGVQLHSGKPLQVVDLPMPAPLVFDGLRLPASYANFLIANTAVLVPTFNDAKDRQALGILADLFDRPVVGIHAADLVLGRGAVHCLSMQIPSASR